MMVKYYEIGNMHFKLERIGTNKFILTITEKTINKPVLEQECDALGAFMKIASYAEIK